MPLPRYIRRCFDCGTNTTVKTDNPMRVQVIRSGDRKGRSFNYCGKHWGALSPTKKANHLKQYPARLTS